MLYVDHLGTAALREKYAGDAALRPERIVDIDIIWRRGAFRVARSGQRTPLSFFGSVRPQSK